MDAPSHAAPLFDLEQVERLLTTTKAVRRRLDLSRPVEDDVIRDCIRLACHAPNASNYQTWRWIVVTDPELRGRIGDEYRRILRPAVTPMRVQKEAAGEVAGVRISDSVLYLADHMGEVPALVILGFWFVEQAIFGAAGLANPAGGGGGVAYFAHVGGFVFGLAVIRLLAVHRQPEPPRYPVY